VTGLSPFNPSVILNRFNLNTPLSDSESSGLSTSNWRQTERLLRSVVKDRSDPMAQKLSQAFHAISAQKPFLEHEVRGPRGALINETSRR
jgi:hypothetical protein